ncbi:MAG: hypothetical protein UX75_C0009G0027 [Candidatus Moranbacteria bacterium GW2011_GWE2_47_10]|nr:MAG: hypothetical protein UX75_C0009G0027 [Candidatus Moranbacteria bacterium GW2011_GWE2_47_10]
MNFINFKNFQLEIYDNLQVIVNFLHIIQIV